MCYSANISSTPRSWSGLLHQLQSRVVADEVLVAVGVCVRDLRPDLPEAVDVQLPHEGGPLVVAVGAGDDLGGEATSVQDDEGLAVLRPASYLRGTVVDERVSLFRVRGSEGSEYGLTRRTNSATSKWGSSSEVICAKEVSSALSVPS